MQVSHQQRPPSRSQLDPSVIGGGELPQFSLASVQLRIAFASVELLVYIGTCHFLLILAVKLSKGSRTIDDG